eukprot:Skav200394  [mRNA]  locus=scaffold1919:77025:79775:+ [translate_table: standard]
MAYKGRWCQLGHRYVFRSVKNKESKMAKYKRSLQTQEISEFWSLLDGSGAAIWTEYEKRKGHLHQHDPGTHGNWQRGESLLAALGSGLQKFGDRGDLVEDNSRR